MRASLGIFGFVLVLASAACFGSGGSSGGSGPRLDAGASGTSQHDAAVSGKDAGAPVYVPPKCRQQCQDYLSSYAIATTVWFIYNQNIPGRPGGSVDVTATCPLGGTAHVTGTANGSTDGTSTVHLVFELAACRNTDARYSLSFDGTVSMDGTFNGGSSTGTKFTAVVFSASTLVLSGELKYLDDPAIDETCELSERDQRGDTQTLDGTLCGREFSSQTAFDDSGGGYMLPGDGGTAGSSAAAGSGASGGSAGTSGAGGSGSGAAGSSGSAGSSSCTCYCGWPADQVCKSNSDCPADTSVPGTSVPGVCGCPVGC